MASFPALGTRLRTQRAGHNHCVRCVSLCVSLFAACHCARLCQPVCAACHCAACHCAVRVTPRLKLHVVHICVLSVHSAACSLRLACVVHSAAWSAVPCSPEVAVLWKSDIVSGLWSHLASDCPEHQVTHTPAAPTCCASILPSCLAVLRLAVLC